MGGCAVRGCSNSRRNGFTMKLLPRNQERRAIWLKAMNRLGLMNSVAATVCEIHFAANSWEKTRVDGSRKLKCNAVPTLFLDTSHKKQRDSLSQEASEEPVTEPEIFQNALLNGNETDPQTSVTDVMPNSPNKKDEPPENNSISQSTPHTKSNPDLGRYNNILLKYQQKLNMLQKKLKLSRIENKRLRTTASGGTAWKRIFNDDQIEILEKKHNKCKKWSKETLKRALKLKFACGNTGYNELRRQKFPLPSLRTLSTKVQHINFTSGIHTDIFELLKDKFSSVQHEHERECILMFDEMSIQPAKVHDISTNQYIGNVTLPEHEGIATHALAFMITGLTVPWKQVVAHYFTGDSVNGASLKPIVLEIIERAWYCGLKVSVIVSDMGAANRALWASLGVCAGRNIDTNNSIPHPMNNEEKLFFLADVPHALKNLKTALLNNKVILLPEKTQKKYELPTHAVQAKHFEELISLQSNFQFLIAPKLKKDDVDVSKTFAKMRVNKARNVFSHQTSTSLQLAAENRKDESYRTTAWFVEIISRWFTLMTSRNHTVALSTSNMDKYNEALNLLTEIIEIFRDVQIGNKRVWKPVQTGILISTSSVLELAEYYLQERNLPFLLTGRLTQDPCENLFSVIRSKHPLPNALQFQQDLKLICISQYMTNIRGSNYDFDDRSLLGDFFDLKKNVTTENALPDTPIPDIPDIQHTPLKLSTMEMNSFYYAAGYIVKSICQTQKIDGKQFLKEKFLLLPDPFLDCHDIKLKIASRFAVFRMRIAGQRKYRSSSVAFSSKTMAMHSRVH